jgi:hypothetical protein
MLCLDKVARFFVRRWVNNLNRGRGGFLPGRLLSAFQTCRSARLTHRGKKESVYELLDPTYKESVRRAEAKRRRVTRKKFS